MTDQEPRMQEQEPVPGGRRRSREGYGSYGGYGAGLYDADSELAWGEGIDLAALFGVLWRKKLTVILGTAMVVLMALVYLRLATPMFESKSLVELSLRRPRIMGQQDAVINDMGTVAAGDLLNTQMLKLQGQPLREAVLKDLLVSQKAIVAADTNTDWLGFLNSNVRIELIRRSSLIRITALSSNPVFAAALANAYANTAVSSAFSANKDASENAVQWLQSQAESQGAILKQAESELLTYRKDSLIETLIAERRVAEEAVLTYNGEVAKAVSMRNAALARYTAKHPEVIAQEQLIATAQKQLDMEMGHVRELEKKIADGNSRLSVLDRTRETAELSYKGILRRMEEARLSADENTATIKVVETAEAPKVPIKPNKLLILAAAILLGPLFGGAVALILYKLEDRVWYTTDVTQSTGLKLLGSIPHGRHIKRDRIALTSADEKFSAIAESYSGIRGVLDAGQCGKTFLVTSSMAEEGKTVSCCNLAIASAKSGIRTLIVDLDLRRPRLRHIFNVAVTEKNLIQVQLLNDESTQDFGTLPVHTTIANLDVVASRPTEFLSPGEVLGSGRIQKFIKWAAANYDRVFIDSPPVGLVSDSMSLGWAVDSVIFVCRFNKSRKSMVRAAVRRLQDGGGRIVGVIVNDVQIQKMGYYYRQSYHGYHYHPESEYGDRKETGKQPGKQPPPNRG